MKLHVFVFAAAVAVVLSAIGCGPTTQQVLAIHENDLVLGSPDNNLPLLLEKAEKKNDEELLWRLMAGTAYHVVNRPGEAIRQFDLAEDIFSRNDKSPVFAKGADGAMSILNNEKSFPYNGIGQERIFCCFYKALDFSELGKPDAVRTELNRAMEHQENWLFERRKEISGAEVALEKAARAKEKEKSVDSRNRDQNVNGIMVNTNFLGLIARHCRFDMRKSGNIGNLRPADYQNAYLTHFCGVFRYLNGDGGRVYLRNASSLKPGVQTLKNDFAMIESGRAPSNDVWLYMEDGLCPKRQEVRFDLPMFLIPYANRYVQYVCMALPVLVPRSAAANLYTVGIDGKDYSMELLEDVDHLIQTEYDVYMHGAVKRELTRCLVKVSVQVTLGVLADQTNDQYAQMGFRLGQAAAVTWAVATTAADTRSWTSLPKRVFVAHIQRPTNGKVTVKVDGTPFDVDLPTGNSIVWMRKTAPSAPVRLKILSVNPR